VLALKTLWDPEAAGELTASCTLRLDGQAFRARVAGGRLTVERGEEERPDAVIAGEPAALAAVLWHGRGLDDAVTAGELAVQGDRGAIARFLGLFPLPSASA
jgi:hypothetical protein